MTQTIILDSSKRLPFSKNDVAKIFGIPCEGKKVTEQFCTDKPTIKYILTEYLGASAKECRSIKPALRILTQVHKETMTNHEQNAFKIAFVIYMMSTLLSPGSKFDYVSYEYWNALTNPSKISAYDWSDYVIQKLLDSTVKLKNDLKTSAKVANITGCALFLQVTILKKYIDKLHNFNILSGKRLQMYS
jgi:hypothetical protein